MPDETNVIDGWWKRQDTWVKVVAGALASTLTASNIVKSTDQNYAFFDSEVRNEIEYWHDLNDKYFKIAGTTGTGDLAKRNDEFESLCRLGMIDPSELKGRSPHRLLFWEDGDYRETMIKRIRAAKEDFTGVIAKSPLTKDLESCHQLVSGAQAEKTNFTERDGRGFSTEAAKAATSEAVAADEPQVKKLTEASEANVEIEIKRQSLTFQAGDSKGYDIDVFWCERPLDSDIEKGIFALGLKTAEALKVKVIGTHSIGRIRLRPLTSAAQLRAGYPSSGLQVRGEDSEAEVRTAVVASLNETLKPQIFTDFPSQMKTPWYLSVFVCSPAPPEAPKPRK